MRVMDLASSISPAVATLSKDLKLRLTVTTDTRNIKNVDCLVLAALFTDDANGGELDTQLVSFFPVGNLEVALIHKIVDGCIRDAWQLHKKVGSFSHAKNGEENSLGKLVEGCLASSGIDSMFTITVGKASSDDVDAASLKVSYADKESTITFDSANDVVSESLRLFSAWHPLGHRVTHVSTVSESALNLGSRILDKFLGGWTGLIDYTSKLYHSPNYVHKHWTEIWKDDGRRLSNMFKEMKLSVKVTTDTRNIMNVDCIVLAACFMDDANAGQLDTQLVSFFPVGNLEVALVHEIVDNCLNSFRIRDAWQLHKKVGSFSHVTNGEENSLGKLVECCLEVFEIDSLFTITVGKASSDDVDVASLKVSYADKESTITIDSANDVVSESLRLFAAWHPLGHRVTHVSTVSEVESALNLRSRILDTFTFSSDWSTVSEGMDSASMSPPASNSAAASPLVYRHACI